MGINLQNKVIIITGAGKGIGYDTAKTFYEYGAKIAVISRDKADLIKLKNNLNASDDRFFFMEGDVSIEDVIMRFVTEVHEKFHHIDCLINNAGIRFRKNFLEISNEEWQKVMNVNLGSAFLFSKAVIPYMMKQKKGRIINMASIVGSLGLPELSAYASSKGGIISLTKSLALEFAEYNINVNAIAPGFCKTSYAEGFKNNNELYNFTIERTPLKRWGEARDVANACIYLASDLSNYVTGEILHVDGGWSAW
jgi:2-deoxy-D-gluconate 3-dehydrogenase